MAALWVVSPIRPTSCCRDHPDWGGGWEVLPAAAEREWGLRNCLSSLQPACLSFQLNPAPPGAGCDFLPGKRGGAGPAGMGVESLRSLSSLAPYGSNTRHGSHRPLTPAQAHAPLLLSPQGRAHSHLVPTQVPLTEVIEPLDFEDVLLSRPPDAEPGPLRDLAEFPADDLELLLQPRECRTTEPGIPEDGWVQPHALLVCNSGLPLCPSSTPPFHQAPNSPKFNSWLGCVTLGKLPSLSERPSPHLQKGQKGRPHLRPLERLTLCPASVYPDLILCRKLDAQVRAAVEMYTEDWIIAHRRWVWLRGSSGQGVKRPGLSPLGQSSCLSAHRPCKGSWPSLVVHRKGGWPCRHHMDLWVCPHPCFPPCPASSQVPASECGVQPHHHGDAARAAEGPHPPGLRAGRLWG